MAKQPEFTKYRPLDEWFRLRSASEKALELTFAQVEGILGEPLPSSARKAQTWWTNVLPKIQSHRTSWLNHGWRVSSFDLQAQTVKFVRT